MSPSGRFAFIACNNSSEIVVVDVDDKKVINRIHADPYPVGLDISPDGTLLVSTSQGHNGEGGNAVNFFQLEYAFPEIPIDEKFGIENETTNPVDTLSSSNHNQQTGADDKEKEGGRSMIFLYTIIICIIVLAIILVGFRLIKKRRR